MAETYKLLLTGGVIRQSDSALIPNDPNNTDWKSYQDWLGQGNTPIAADPAPTAAQILADMRAGAIVQLGDPSSQSKFIRAVLLTILDELNTIRALLVPAQAARTPAQMKNAIQAKITGGTAD